MDYYHLVKGQRVEFILKQKSVFSVKVVGSFGTAGSHKLFVHSEGTHSLLLPVLGTFSHAAHSTSFD